MSYSEHTWQTGETITAAKMNNIEEGIQEAAQSGGAGGLDFILWYPNSVDGWQSTGDFAAVKAKLINSEPVFGVVYENSSLDSTGYALFSSLVIPYAVMYLPEHDRITIQESSLAGWEWDSNGISYYNND